MAPAGLTVLASLRPGADVVLRPMLRAIGDDIRGRRLAGAAAAHAHIDFPRSSGTHFARFALIPDPDRGEGRMRLLYSSNHDGDLASHLDELAAITSDLDAVWGHCEGYAGRTTFVEFIRAHALQPQAFYIAFRGGSVAQVRRDVTDDLRMPARDIAAKRALARLRALARAAPLPMDVLRAAIRYGPSNVWWAGRAIVASLDRVPLLRLFNAITENRMIPMRSRHSSAPLDQSGLVRPTATPGGEPPPSFREDAVAQNQLTLLTPVDPRRAKRLEAVLAGIDVYARRLSPSGSLLGISTIHFVRWLVIDDGRRLLMLSDYDGSWESYIDEFAEMILSGLDAIWSSAPGYPPDGARDLPAFKWFLRSHQVPAELFYSAYPATTTLHIRANPERAGRSM